MLAKISDTVVNANCYLFCLNGLLCLTLTDCQYIMLVNIIGNNEAKPNVKLPPIKIKTVDNVNDKVVIIAPSFKVLGIANKAPPKI